VPIKLQYFTSPIDRQTYTGQVSFFSTQQAEKRGVAVAEQAAAAGFIVCNRNNKASQQSSGIQTVRSN